MKKMGKKIFLPLILIAYLVASCTTPTASATSAPIKSTVVPCRGKMPVEADKFAKTLGEPIVTVPILSSLELGVGFFIETVPGNVLLATARHVVPLKDNCGILFTIPGQKILYSVSVDNFKKWSGKSDVFIVYELPPETAKEVLRFAKNGELRIFTVSNTPGAGETVFLPVANTAKYAELRVERDRKNGDDRIIAGFTDGYLACQGDSGSPILETNHISIVGVLSAIESEPPYFKIVDKKDCSSRIYFTPAIPTPH
ncbi:MAG: hypothetical protein AAB508_06860 [Patescibacteria group bacterium]